MPLPATKVQPIDSDGLVRSDQAKPVPAKSRLKRLFERQFPGVLQRISSAERLAGADLEPSSICLDKMVRNFMEDGNGSEKPSSRCGRSRCNCFHGNDSSDDEADFPSSYSAGDALIAAAASSDTVEVIKGLVLCPSLAERNLLADASSIVDKSKHCKRKDEFRKAVAEGLRSLGYDASICRSRWEKTPSFPAGKYEYVDVLVGGERVLVDVDFRSEFEIARSTKSYRAVLQSVPCVFVGKEDRLDQIVGVVSEAAQLSLKKKGLHFPPWRKPEYMRAKWLSPYSRSIPAKPKEEALEEEGGEETEDSGNPKGESKTSAAVARDESEEAEEKAVVVVASSCEPPEVKPKASQNGAKVVTGFVLTEKP